MKTFHKFQRVIAACLLTILLFTASMQNTVALGTYTQATPLQSQNAMLEEAVFPAVAAVAFGVVVVGAFAYGVYTGYREAANGDSNNMANSVLLDPYQSNDFSEFDLKAAAI
ncbi:hypothetical protein KBK19_08755 [Microvirga sp. STR05]|uniref:DUF4134 domain-containing protein n=1 Tax=Hymenobacter duratus TaxID=2771356 RepID=A0ABR8JHE1_9BACT|nr:hypothetical protein [Hymenobacter duratus]MBD2715123.1 hypothetical protein [Hymenobacter duratus]MBR7950029.1 hypothetical protein [Microvirga sp. STR05]